MNGAKVFVRALIDMGIDSVFVYPGGTIAPIVNECISNGIKIESFKNEQGAAYAAIAIAKMTNRLQVVLVTSGPGFTNTLTPISDCYYDSIPVLFVSGQISSVELSTRLNVRQRGFQEVPAVDMSKPVTKLSILLDDTNNIYRETIRACKKALFGRKGSVHIDFPMNIQRSEDIEISKNDMLRVLNEKNIPSGNNDIICDNDKKLIIENFIKKLNDEPNARVTLILGNGVLHCSFIDSVYKLVNLTNCDVVTSLLGVGSINTNHLNYCGYLGHTGHAKANASVYNATYLIVLGSRLDVRQTGSQVGDFAKDKHILWIDIDDSELKDGRIEVGYKVHSSIDYFFSDLIDLDTIISRKVQPKLITREDDDFIEQDSLMPKTVFQSLNDSLSDSKYVVTTGVGSHQQWAARYISFEPMFKLFLTSGGHGTMGFDIPAAIGAALDKKDYLVTCIVGDGSFLMNVQELATIVERNLNILIIVINNKRLGMVSQFQKITWGADPTTGDIHAISAKSIASGFGIESYIVSDLKDLSKKIDYYKSNNKPLLLELFISEKADVSPMLLGGSTLDNLWWQENE